MYGVGAGFNRLKGGKALAGRGMPGGAYCLRRFVALGSGGMRAANGLVGIVVVGSGSCRSLCREDQVMQHSKFGRALRRGFSLIEMLVVLLILTVVISIVVPALRHFRNVARKSATTELMVSLGTAVSQFKLSQGRLPGYFTPVQMGEADNPLAALDNMLFDLAGGISTETTSTITDPCNSALNYVVEVGPTSAPKKVKIDTGRIGSAEGGARGNVNRGYFRPDPKYFKRQCAVGQRAPTGLPNEYNVLPSLVDAWGTPVLAWVSDDVPPGFELTSATSATRARFYLASNSCFTNASKLGTLQQDQTDVSQGSLLSTLGGADRPAISVEGVVGNPAFSGEARGPVVFHSAGANGIYIGRNERGGKAFTGSGTSPLRQSLGRDYFQEGDFDDFVTKAE